MESTNNVTFDSAKEKLAELINQGLGRYKIAENFNISPSKARRWIDRIKKEEVVTVEEEISEEELVKLGMSRQSLMDKNRVCRKFLRENYRIVNVIEELNKEFVSLLNEKTFTTGTIEHVELKKGNTVAVIQLSDLHFNELITGVGENRYDFTIASARLKLFAQKAKQYLAPMGVTHVLIAMTGDLLNSDRRMDEILSQATNRTKATFLAIDILNQFIRDLNEVFNVSVIYVTGNESRVKQELSWSDVAVSDNYDTMIFDVLRYLFMNSKGINFIVGDPVECVMNINGSNVLFMHGNGSIQNGATERSVAQIKGRYASRGTIIDYVIFGHMHSAQLGDMYSRSSSLCGSNAYSEKSLNLAGRASQNIYIFYENGLRDAIKVDLQVNEGDAYKVDVNLATYNPKSADKTESKTSIFSVVI